jgi:hypothetical protein
MDVKPMMMLVFLAAPGCAEAVARAPPSASARAAAPMTAARTDAVPAPVPRPSPAEGDPAYAAQLGVARGGQFDVDRQVTELQRAVLLYTQFLERAEGRPELLPAVRKARERIADANDTLIFLTSESRSQH